MTRLSVSDLNPRMRKQVMRILAEEEKEKKQTEKATISHGRLLSKKAEKQEDGDGKRSKYKAQKVTVLLPDGEEHTFDSAKEARVYNDLLIRLKAGEISDLRIQVPYLLIPKQIKTNGKTERKCEYIADFVYEENGKTHVVDVKGYRKSTAYAVFVIKRKLMLWIHGIEIEEI